MTVAPTSEAGELNTQVSKKVWDTCTSCFCDIHPSQKPWDWRQCKRCNYVSLILKVTLGFGILAVIWALWKKTNFRLGNLNIYTVGYIIDILGGWFLANGLTDLFLLAGDGWGGADIAFKSYGKKSFYFRSAGIFLLLLGFIIQCIANILSSTSQPS
jgi:hypothetical protein